MINDSISSAIHCLKTATFIRDEFEKPHIAIYSDIVWVSFYISLKSLKKYKNSICVLYDVKESENQPVKNKLSKKNWDYIDQTVPLFFKKK